jgi:chaperone required for assembly of F1-ATPase
MRHELKVNRSELVEGLSTLRKSVKRKTKSDAVFTFEKGRFVVFLDGSQSKRPRTENSPEWFALQESRR